MGTCNRIYFIVTLGYFFMVLANVIIFSVAHHQLDLQMDKGTIATRYGIKKSKTAGFLVLLISLICSTILLFMDFIVQGVVHFIMTLSLALILLKVDENKKLATAWFADLVFLIPVFGAI
ncbi:MAG: hypothetical protein HC906_17390 [Bacteroidales bacterium]|nr:hypothetical protein [Bacteroidales bacterium]